MRGLVLIFAAGLMAAMADPGDGRSEVIVEARMIKPGEGGKYKWMSLEIRRVLKRTEKNPPALPRVLEVVQITGAAEVSEKWSVIRLRPFQSEIHPGVWEVVEIGTSDKQ